MRIIRYLLVWLLVLASVAADGGLVGRDAKHCRVMVFTMDSLTSMVKRRKHEGGPGGEYKVRKHFQNVLRDQCGCRVDVMASDKDVIDFLRRTTWEGFKEVYTHIVVDEWTCIKKGRVLKEWMTGIEDRVFITAFFGMGPNFRINPTNPFSLKQALVPYPTSTQNTFIGFPLDVPEPVFDYNKRSRVDQLLYTLARSHSAPDAPPPLVAGTDGVHPRSVAVGVLWGKELRYLEAGKTIIRVLRRRFPFLSLRANVATAPRGTTHPFFNETDVFNMQHLPYHKYTELMREALFVIGFGDPILGPTALEAIAFGATYINPRFARAKKTGSTRQKSQHDYASEVLRAPYVCDYEHMNVEDAVRCVEVAALRAGIAPEWLAGGIPEDKTALEESRRRAARMVASFAQGTNDAPAEITAEPSEAGTEDNAMLPLYYDSEYEPVELSYVDDDFTPEAHADRVRNIFGC